MRQEKMGGRRRKYSIAGTEEKCGEGRKEGSKMKR